MAVTLTQAPTVSELGRLRQSWMRQLRGDKSDATRRAYGYAVTGLERFLVEAGMPTDPSWITTEHINAYLDHEMATNSHSTAKLRRTYLSVFFTWLVNEGEIKAHPVRRAKVPSVTDRPNDVLDDAGWEKLLATVTGRSLADRRDAAIFRVLESSGLRRTECANLRVGDVDLDAMTIRAKVKGNRLEVRVIDDAAAAAVDRYLRHRRDNVTPSRPLWVTRNGGPLSPEGLARMIVRRGQEAGIRLHAHMLRHRWAELNKSAGMSDEALMALGGWKSRAMVDRYARATRVPRAIEQYREIRRRG